MSGDKDVWRRQLQSMDEQLTVMIGTADDQRDHLLGALLCEVHACVVRRYAELLVE